MKKLFLLLPALGALSCASVGASDDQMKPWPAPEKGYQRYAIDLPPQADEFAFKVEILVGKTLPVDCNRISIGGELREAVAEGWGYPYFVLEKVSPPASTKMACPPDMKPQPQFVPVHTDNNILRYNSKLPLVVYVPDGFEVRHRIWQAGEVQSTARRR